MASDELDLLQNLNSFQGGYCRSRDLQRPPSTDVNGELVTTTCFRAIIKANFEQACNSSNSASHERLEGSLLLLLGLFGHDNKQWQLTDLLWE